MKSQHTDWHNYFWKIILLFILGLTAYLLFNKLITPKLYPLINPSLPNNTEKEKNALGEVVTKSLEGATGTYAVAIKNLKTGESYYSLEHQQFKSGSLYKLWIMAAAFKQIQSGELKEDEDLNGDVATLNREFGIDPDSAELQYGTIDFTVGSALIQMISISHNYAAMLLTDRIKLSSAENFLVENGFKESKIGVENEPPATSTYDTALFFEKLYKGELADVVNTNKMLELLKSQQLNSKLPKYLPEGTIVAHKTGEIDYLTHDAGIVYTPKGDYIIVIMSESDSPANAEERIALVSEAVFDYFESK